MIKKTYLLLIIIFCLPQFSWSQDVKHCIKQELAKRSGSDNEAISLLNICKASSESQMVDKGISLDDLLADIDPVTSDDSNIKLVPEETAKPGLSLDDLLAEIDPVISSDSNTKLVPIGAEKASTNSDNLPGDPEENIKKQQLAAYNDGSYCGGLLSSLEDQYRALIKVSYDLCRTKVNHFNEFIEAQSHLFNNATTKMSDADLEKAHEHFNELAHCYKYDGETLIYANHAAEDTRISIVYGEKCRGNKDTDRVDYNGFPTTITNRRYDLNFIVANTKRLLFDIEEHSNFQRRSEVYTRVRDALNEYLEEQMSEAKDNGGNDLAILGQYLGYNSVPTAILYDAIPTPQPEINNEPLPELTVKPIEASPRAEDTTPTLTLKTMPAPDPASNNEPSTIALSNGDVTPSCLGLNSLDNKTSCLVETSYSAEEACKVAKGHDLRPAARRLCGGELWVDNWSTGACHCGGKEGVNVSCRVVFTYNCKSHGGPGTDSVKTQ